MRAVERILDTGTTQFKGSVEIEVPGEGTNHLKLGIGPCTGKDLLYIFTLKRQKRGWHTRSARVAS